MQSLPEPTAATLKVCGYALQSKPRENQQKQKSKNTQKQSENVWSHAYVCFWVLSIFFCFDI